MKLKEIYLTHMVKHLLQLCRDELNLDSFPEILFIDNKDSIGNGSSFGEFDGSIKVVITNRHPMDIMRTLAHELVHWKQNITGMELDGSDGSEIENEANSTAGVIMRKFAKMYPQYFVNSLPD